MEGLEFSATRDLQPVEGVDRRQLLVRAVGAVGAFAGVGLGLRTSSAEGLGPALLVDRFGARGDGRSDDTAALQAVLNAAGPGTTILGRARATYVITNTLTFPADGVTLDLGGASIRAGRTPASGSDLQTHGTLFSIINRTGVRITNGTILGAVPSAPGTGPSLLLTLPFLDTLLSIPGNGTPYLIHIVGGQSCRIDHLTAACDGSLFAYLSGQGHSIGHNTIKDGGIAGLATTNVTVQHNVLKNSPADAISFTGYSGAPVTGNRYLNNEISGYGRVAIEEYSPSGATYCVGSVFSGNTISSPSASNTSGTGISAISKGATIKNNQITDAIGWGIEATGLGTTVSGNRIGWSSVGQTALESTAIVINTSLASDTRPVTVSGNTINRGSTGIEMYGRTFFCPVAIKSNRLKDPVQRGILLAPAAQVGLVRVIGNVVTFDQPPQAGTARYGITTASGAVLIGNEVLYAAAARGADTPYATTGSNITMTDNVSRVVPAVP